MYSTLLADATFHQLLLAFDQDIANTARQEPCALCAGVLHSGRYRRNLTQLAAPIVENVVFYCHVRYSVSTGWKAGHAENVVK
jgi:hypothetical protein